MGEKELSKFYFTFFLLITGFCFLLFSLLLSIVDDHNIKFFVKTGLIAFVSGILTGANTLIKQVNKRKTT